MITRIPEPALIENKNEIDSWAMINRNLVNTSFSEWFKFRKNKEGIIVNLGCGVANLEVTLLDVIDDLHFLSVDGSKGMIETARQTIKSNGIEDYVTLKNIMIEDVGYVENCNTVISHGVLHHFEDPTVFWNSASKIPEAGGIIMVMDLLRPNTEEELENIVAEWGQDNEEYIDSLRRSLYAAFTEQEVREQLTNLEMEHEVLTFEGADSGNLMMISAKVK